MVFLGRGVLGEPAWNQLRNRATATNGLIRGGPWTFPFRCAKWEPDDIQTAFGGLNIMITLFATQKE